MRDDTIRLTLPPDGDLAAVVVAALGALARGARLSAHEVEHIREEGAAAFLAMLEQVTDGEVEVEASADRRGWTFEIRGSGASERRRSGPEG